MRKPWLSGAYAALVAAAACGGSGETTGPLEHGMRLTAVASLQQDSAGTMFVDGVLTLTNKADSTIRIAWGECPSNGPLIVSASPVAQPQSTWNATAAYRDVNCFLTLFYFDLSPGQTWRHDTKIPVRDILGDSLAAGVYTFTGSAAALEPGFSQDLPMGELTLNRAP